MNTVDLIFMKYHYWASCQRKMKNFRSKNEKSTGKIIRETWHIKCWHIEKHAHVSSKKFHQNFNELPSEEIFHFTMKNNYLVCILELHRFDENAHKSEKEKESDNTKNVGPTSGDNYGSNKQPGVYLRIW